MIRKQQKVKGRITTNNHTAGHAAWLSRHGYSVEVFPDHIVVEGTGWVEGLLDLSGGRGKATLEAIVAAKKLLTYKVHLLVDRQAVTPSGETVTYTRYTSSTSCNHRVSRVTL